MIPPGFRWRFWISAENGPLLGLLGPELADSDGDRCPLRDIRATSIRLAAKAWARTRTQPTAAAEEAR